MDLAYKVPTKYCKNATQAIILTAEVWPYSVDPSQNKLICFMRVFGCADGGGECGRVEECGGEFW